MNIPVWNCSEFEAAVSDYRDGTLRLERAAAARDHLTACENCAALLAGVAQAVAAVQALPRVEPPARLLTNVLAQTLPAHVRPRGRLAAGGPGSRWRRVWSGVANPRFAMGMAMSVFAVALLLNAAQINVRDVFSGEGASQFSLAGLSTLGSSLQRQFSRGWARGVSYYHDLRVVYEIEAAVHSMRQNASPAAAPSGHDHSQAAPGDRPNNALALQNPLQASTLGSATLRRES